MSTKKGSMHVIYALKGCNIRIRFERMLTTTRHWNQVLVLLRDLFPGMVVQKNSTRDTAAFE